LDFLLELLSVHLDERVKSEILSFDLKFLPNQSVDLIPMLTFQVIVPQCYHNWHGCFEGINEDFEFLCDRVVRKILFDSVADLRELISFGLDILGVDVGEFFLDPTVGLFLPLVQRSPH
jgi:hypothetical protein